MIGIASTIARVTGPQWTRSSSRSTNSPSENRVRISASSTRSTIAGSRASTETTPVSARTMPSATESTEIDSTVPRITPESAADDGQQPPDDQQGVAEPDLHDGLIFGSGPAAGGRYQSTYGRSRG